MKLLRKSLLRRLFRPRADQSGPQQREPRKNGYALMMVLFFAGISMLALAGALQWTSNSARLNQRNSNYFNAAGAAEAATEKILTQVSRDYRASGEAAVYNNLASYRAMVPTTTESSAWQQYQFSDAQGNTNSTYIDRVSAWAFVPLASQYQGLYGLAATYRVISNARMLGVSNPPLIAGVKQEVQVASIPVFQFAIFYAIDLEINPGQTMNVRGRVHSNGSIYTQPQPVLTFMDHVTSAGTIYLVKDPLDPTTRAYSSATVFQAAHDSKVSALTLPIGTNNSPSAVRTVVDIPPVGELPGSLVGQQRYYNKADLIILVSNTTVTAKSGAVNNYGTPVTWGEISGFVKTNVSFYNAREGKTIKAVEIDVGKLKTWTASVTNTLRTLLNQDLDTLYVADMRTQSGSTESGVRLVNGQTLPSLGLTVATPNPIYIQGNYNCPTAALGTTNTLGTKPASIVADAITILSTVWGDGNSQNSNAADTTVNAAFLAGIVPSDGSNYSGGVENFPRFLENWSTSPAKIFTYNGSMVVMFYSQYATAPWGGSNVYGAPARNWAFDLNFMDATKLPPGTPELLTMIRGLWASVPSGSIL